MRISSGVQHHLLKRYLRSIVWPLILCQRSVQFSRSVGSDSLQLHESQHARSPCQRSVDCNYVCTFLGYYSFYWSMSLFCYQSHSVLITVALEQIFRLGNVSPPTLFFNISWLFWVFCFSIWTLELLCWNPQNNAGILIGITLNL